MVAKFSRLNFPKNSNLGVRQWKIRRVLPSAQIPWHSRSGRTAGCPSCPSGLHWAQWWQRCVHVPLCPGCKRRRSGWGLLAWGASSLPLRTCWRRADRQTGEFIPCQVSLGFPISLSTNTVGTIAPALAVTQHCWPASRRWGALPGTRRVWQPADAVAAEALSITDGL